MAFVMLKNTLISSSVIFRSYLTFRPFLSLTGSSRYNSNLLIKQAINLHRCISYTHCRQFAVQQIIQEQHLENVGGVEETVEKQDERQSTGGNIQTQGIAKPTRFKTKATFLKHFDERISEGNVLPTTLAFAFLKSCGLRMVGETDASRNEVVNYVWNELEKNGVDLQPGLWNTLLSVYVENRHEFEPLEFLKSMWEKSSVEPNKTTFSLLIQAYGIKGDPAGAMKIVEFMLKTDSKMTEHIYGWLVQAFAKKGDMNGVEEILKSMQENGIQARHTTFGNLIDAHAERGDLENINKTISEMIDRKIYPTSTMYISMLDHLSTGGHSNLIPSVWGKIDDNEYMDEDVKPLIERCITRGDYESALTLLECSVKRLSIYEDNYFKYLEQRLFNMMKLFEMDLSEFLKVSSLLEKRLSQDPLTRVHHLVGFLVSNKDAASALEVMQLLISKKKNVTVRMFHPILQAYANKNDIQGIVDVFQYMVENEINLDYYCYKYIQPAIGEVNSDEYKHFISLVKENEKIILPFKVMSEVLDDEDVKLSDISGLAKNASTAELFSSLKSIKNALSEDFNAIDAAKILTLLHKRGMKDITVLICELMGILIDGIEKKPKEALQFMKSLMENGVPIASPTYTKMLKSLYSERMSDQFFMFVRLMKEHGVEPDVHQYFQMLKMAARVGNSMAAQFCFDKVKDSPTFPNRKHQCYEFLITAYGKDYENSKVIPTYIQGRGSENAENIVQIFQEMQEKNYRPSHFTITTVIRSYLVNNDVDGAMKVIEEYGEGKEELRPTLKNSFMRAYVARKDFQAADKLFDEMKSESTVTPLQYNEMLRMCEMTGDTQRVEALYKEMVDNRIELNVFTYLHRIQTFLASKQPEPCIAIIEENLASGKDILRVDVFMTVLRQLVPTANIENVKKVINLIKEHHITKVPPKRLTNALILVHIKAGDLEGASKLLPQPSEDTDEPVEIELNPYRKVAKSASIEGDVQYIENMMKFLKQNGFHYKSLDIFYLLALDKTNNIEGIRNVYRERTEDGIVPNDKFISTIKAIMEDRGLKDLDAPQII